MSTQTSDVSRTKYFDYLRVFSSFSIMLVHVAAYPWYYMDISTSDWMVLDIYKSIARAPVVIFMMISGALFLGRSIPIKKLYGKYVLRIAIAFVFWNIVYAVITFGHLGIRGIIFKLFNSNYHLWFLLALLGLYICVPLLKLIADNEKILKYFLIISGIITFLVPSILLIAREIGPGPVSHVAEILQGHFYDMHLDTFLGYTFYFLAGFYLHNHDIGKTVRRVIYVLGLACLVFGVVLNIYYSRANGTPLDVFHNVFMMHEMLEAVAIFIFFKYNIKGNSKLDKIAYKISAVGLGAYLVHDLVILGLDRFLGLNAVIFSPIIAVPAMTLLTFALSTLISWALNKIPYFNRYMV